MGVKIIGRYMGGLAMEMTHEMSGAKLETDPPRDNGGDGKSFSPTDLVATALGSCMMSVMSIAAKKQDLDLTGMSCQIEKHMSQDLPRRIDRLDAVVTMPRGLSLDERARMEEIANTCPVIQSLNVGIQINKTYIYQ